MSYLRRETATTGTGTRPYTRIMYGALNQSWRNLTQTSSGSVISVTRLDGCAGGRPALPNGSRINSRRRVTHVPSL